MVGEELDCSWHSQGAKPKVAAARPQETLREVLVRTEVLKEGQDDLLVFVGEWEEALTEGDEIEEGEDRHEPVDVSLTVEVLELHRHRRIHRPQMQACRGRDM